MKNKKKNWFDSNYNKINGQFSHEIINIRKLYETIAP